MTHDNLSSVKDNLATLAKKKKKKKDTLSYKSTVFTSCVKDFELFFSGKTRNNWTNQNWYMDYEGSEKMSGKKKREFTVFLSDFLQVRFVNPIIVDEKGKNNLFIYFKILNLGFHIYKKGHA